MSMMTKETSIAEIDAKKELVKRLYCKGSSDDELELFLHACKRTGLDPFMKQIYAIKRGNSMTIQTGIDGLRLVAERTGNYSPGRESSFAYDDKGNVISATSYIKKRTSDNTWHEVAATAYMDEYNPKQGLWSKMPRAMLSKCAEALALRKAFPAEMSGLYTNDEMQQADPKGPVELEEVPSESQFAELDSLILEVEEIDPDYLEKVRTTIGVSSFYEMDSIETDRAIRSLKKRLSAPKGNKYEEKSA
jgi:phage recombination protein Bet